MEKLREYVQRHKAVSYLFGLGFVVFIKWFGFPLYNLNREWPLTITIVNIYLVLTSAWATGGNLCILFPKKKAAFIVLMAIVFSCGGLICRYSLEFGEVSNTYNFTLVNIMLHLGIFVIISFLGWLYLVKRSAAN